MVSLHYEVSRAITYYPVQDKTEFWITIQDNLAYMVWTALSYYCKISGMESRKHASATRYYVIYGSTSSRWTKYIPHNPEHDESSCEGGRPWPCRPDALSEHLRLAHLGLLLCAALMASWLEIERECS